MALNLIFTLMISLAYGDDKCRGLAFSGGGSKAAFEVGAFQALVSTLPATEYNYNIMTGVSAGSLNVGGLALFARGDEVAASEWLHGFWFNLT